MVNNLTQFTNNELVHIFLNEKDKKKQEKIMETIFFNYYEKFEFDLRAILRSKGIPYDVNEKYYNTIFFEVYERIFSLPLFTKKLKHFDLKREFDPWFKTVIKREIYDWLKKINGLTGLPNYEKLKDSSKIGLEKNDVEAKYLEKYYNNLNNNTFIPNERKHSDETSRVLLKGLIKELPNSQRVTILLEFIAYEDLHPEDITYISEKTGKPEKEIQAQIDALCLSLRNTEQFKQSKNIELILESFKKKEKYSEYNVLSSRERLEAFGVFDLSEIEKEVEKSTFKTIGENIKLKNKQLKSIDKKKKDDLNLCNIELEKLNYMKALKHFKKEKKRFDKTLGDFKAGKFFVRPTYTQIALILGIEKDTVGSRKNRAKETLFNLIKKKRNNYKFLKES